MKRLSLDTTFLLVLLFLTTILFGRHFSNFFFQDDFFNMTIANSQSLSGAFNIFQKPILNFYFYRPLTTQLYWLITQKIFGWNFTYYHLINHIVFMADIVLVFILLKEISKKRAVAFLGAFFYALAASNFYRLFFLSQIQELGLTFFVLLTIICYVRKSSFYILWLILALMSKETAIVIPMVLLAYDLIYYRKPSPKIILPFMIVGLYLLLRVFFFGFASGGAYVYDFSPRKVINNYLWYGLWSVGIPEPFVNITLFKWPTIVNPALFTNFGLWGNPIIILFCLFLGSIFLSIDQIRLKRSFSKELILGFMVFFLFLLPVAFFPFHKFAYSLTLPLVGFDLALAVIVANLPRRAIVLSIILYFLLSFANYRYNLTGHWSSTKAMTSASVFGYFRNKYPSVVNYSNIYFRNLDEQFCSKNKGEAGVSQEVAYGIGGIDGLRLLYKDESLQVYFQDWDQNHHLMANSLMLDSRLFLNR